MISLVFIELPKKCTRRGGEGEKYREAIFIFVLFFESFAKEKKTIGLIIFFKKTVAVLNFTIDFKKKKYEVDSSKWRSKVFTRDS